MNNKYTANYDWLSAPLSIQSLGNTIQNSNNKQVNTTFNFTQLYNKVPFLKKLNKPNPRRASRTSARVVQLPNEVQDTVKTSIKDVINT